MLQKYSNSNNIRLFKGQRAGTCCHGKGTCIFTMLLLIAFLVQSFDKNVQAKALHPAKSTLKLLQSSPSLIQQQGRHKRDTVVNEQQNDKTDDGGDYDENYDVLPDIFASPQPPTWEDHISAKAKQVAQSFQNMWQSLTDSVRHCVDAFRAMFSDDAGDDGVEELTPEQEQQIISNMEEKYRSKQQHDNEVIENKL